MLPKYTNWQVRLTKRLSDLVRNKSKSENRSINKTIVLILEIYFNLKEEHTIINNIEPNTKKLEQANQDPS